MTTLLIRKARRLVTTDVQRSEATGGAMLVRDRVIDVKETQRE